MPKETTEFFIKAVKDTFEYREKNNVQRNDFMQLLIELKNKGRIESADRVPEDADCKYSTKISSQVLLRTKKILT